MPMPAHAQGVAPVIATTSPILVNENETAVATLTASDDDTPSGGLTWTIPSGTDGGADAGKFTLSSTGVLAFISARDYEAPDDADTDNVYDVTVQVSDGTNTVTAALQVTVGNVIELTTLTGPSSVAFPENSWSRVATFTASSEEDRAGIVWTLGGTDSDHFSIDDPPGALRFALDAVAPRIFSEPPDFEAPVDGDVANTYELTLSAAAGGSGTGTHSFTVTVTDVDEEGVLSLSSTSPALGAALTAVLTDPDGVAWGTDVWRWERSTGRNAWTVIVGAAAASYTPVAADTNAFLRVTATYDDEHGTGKTVSEVVPNVVTGPLLAGLTANTNDSRTNAAQALYPAFDPLTLHYGIGCNSVDRLAVTVSALANARVTVGGVQAGRRPVSVDVSENSDVEIRVADGSGAATTYVVHCVPDAFFEVETHTFPNTDPFEDLILFNRLNYVALMDRAGVPRQLRLGEAGTFAVRLHRIGAGGDYRYGFRSGAGYTILDEDFEVVADGVRTVAPLTAVGSHDFQILGNGNYLFMAFEQTRRDFRDIDLPYPDGANVSSVNLTDSAFQIVTPANQAVFTWNSWGKIAIEDCVQHRFPITLATDPDARAPHPSYAHMNGTHLVDGVLAASLRGCGKVLGIDLRPGATRGNVLWRMGRTNLSAAEWAARAIGPRPLDFIGDPEGEFCGQHTARFLPNGNVFLFDNGVHCAIDPRTFEKLGREGDDFSRAVEYALDLENHEAVFVRDHSLRGDRAHVALANGTVDALDNGDWLVSWGRAPAGNDPYPDNEMATLVDPATGQEKLGIRYRHLPSDHRDRRIHATVAPAEALAPQLQPEPLAAEFPASRHNSFVHIGVGDSPQVVVAFNQPVVDFSASSPSISVRGAKVASVSPHLVAGEQANAYVVTLAPTGSGTITIGLVAGETCASAGICTADGAELEKTADAVTIPYAPPPPPGTDLIQMNAAERELAEFGNHKRNGGARFSVEIGDGMRPQRYPRTINYTVDGDATRGEGEDYTIVGCTSSTCSVTLPANRHSALITISVNNDGIDEGTETIVFTLQDGRRYTVIEDRRTTTFRITDDDTRGLAFRRRWADVDEGGSETYTVKLRSQPTAAVTVNITSNNKDVTVDKPSLTFTTSNWNAAQTVRVSAAQDSDAADDTATLTYTTSGGDYGGANALSIDRPIRVDDDDTANPIAPQLPRISLTGGAAVTEGGGASFTVNANPAPTARISVNVEVYEPPGQDFVAANQEGVRTVTLNAGATSATFTVPTVNDGTDEDDGAVQVYVTDGTGYVADQGAAVTVRDDDPIPAAFFRSASSSAAEADGTHVVQVDLTRPAPSGGLTLRYGVSGTATAGGGNDFSIQGSGSLSVAAGAASATISVAINDDSARENAETVILTLAGGTGYTLGSPSAHTLTIADNDSQAQPSASFGSASSSAAESAGTHNVTVSISPAPSSGLTLAYSVAGTATAGGDNDFSIQGSGSLSVAAGATSADIPVAINDDGADEGAETVILTLISGSGYQLGDQTVHILTITDNDDPTPVVSISGSGTITEGGTATFNLSATPAPQSQITVNVNVVDSGSFVNSGQAGSRQVAIGTGGSGSLTVTTDNDTTDEPDGSLTATIASGQGYSPSSSNGSASIAVNDDDPPPPTPAVSISGGGAITEGGTATFTLSASPAPQDNISVNVNVTQSGDFARSGQTGTRRISIGGSGTATFTVTTTNDGTDEPNGSINAAVRSGTDYTVDSQSGSYSVTVNDDDEPLPQISISRDAASVGEGQTASFTLSARPTPTADLVVHLNISQSGDFAVDGTTGAKTVTISANTATASHSVATVDDAMDERDGSVTARVASRSHYRVASANEASVTVTDDDVPVPEIRVTSEQATRPAHQDGPDYEGATLKFTLHADVAPEADMEVTVNVAEPGNAFIDGADAGTRQVTIPARQKKATLSVRTVDDGVEENPSTATVTATVQSGTGYTVASAPRNAAESTVHDNDGLPTLSISDGSAEEGDEVHFVVTLSRAAAHPVRFQYRTESGGYNGRDYGNADTSVDFPYTHWPGSIHPGGTRFEIWVETYDDAHDEGDETFTVILYDPSGATIEDGEGTGTIKDPDPQSGTRAHAPLLPSASNPLREGLVRIVNPSAQAGEVRIVAIDDAGWRSAPVTLGIDAGASAQFTSRDLEWGNAALDLSGAAGPGTGDWRLEVSSDLDVEVLPYARTTDGALSAMREVVPAEDNVHRVALFNAADSPDAASKLRLTNRGTQALRATIAGIDDTGTSPGSMVSVEIEADESVLLTAAELETGGSNLLGALGDGEGQWRLAIASDGDLAVMNLIETSDGNLANLSNATATSVPVREAHVVDRFPSSSDISNEQGVLRIVNRTGSPASVRIEPNDITGWRYYAPLTLTLGANAAANLGTWDLELGNAAKGLSGSAGPGTGGAWRLAISSDGDIEVLEVLTYTRAPNGLLKVPPGDTRAWDKPR